MVITTEYRWTDADRSKEMPGEPPDPLSMVPYHEGVAHGHAQGYREGLRDALKRVIWHWGESVGAFNQELLEDMLAHVEDTGLLPEEAERAG